jgi:hypothetical protein
VVGMDPHKRSVTIEVMDADEQVLGVPGHQVGSSRLTGGSPPSALWRRRVL